MVRLSHNDDMLQEASDINITPFIDVMLVMLIIFMVAAPLATVDIKVDLPHASAAPSPRQPDPIYVTIAADHTLAVGNERIADTQLEAKLKPLGLGKDAQPQRIYLRADKSVAYDSLMQVMNRLRAAGYYRIALVGDADGAGGEASEGARDGGNP